MEYSNNLIITGIHLYFYKNLNGWKVEDMLHNHKCIMYLCTKDKNYVYLATVTGILYGCTSSHNYSVGNS